MQELPVRPPQPPAMLSFEDHVTNRIGAGSATARTSLAPQASNATSGDMLQPLCRNSPCILMPPPPLQRTTTPVASSDGVDAAAVASIAVATVLALCLLCAVSTYYICFRGTQEHRDTWQCLLSASAAGCGSGCGCRASQVCIVSTALLQCIVVTCGSPGELPAWFVLAHALPGGQLSSVSGHQ